jgi:hypothetical protein
MTLLWLVLGFLVLVCLRIAVAALRIAALRRAGLYPVAGQATMADVKRLVRSGRSLWAIRCYREMHPRVSLKEAKRVVDELSISA